MLGTGDKYKRSGWRVLVCGEGGAHQRMVTRLLRDLGVGLVMEAPVMFGHSGPVLRFSPHLILGRICPGNQDVLELIRWLRTPDLSPLPGVSILISVSSADQALLSRTIRAGADLLVAEPLTAAALRVRLDRLITDPPPRIRTPSYFGPDRRRTSQTGYQGEDRRLTSG
jgi:CheY-like chemotaxis protein